MRPWYALPMEERQRAMDEHIRIGAEFPTIHNHTTYSFGIDDQEFMTVFECDEPADFMHLMLTLRETEASALHGARHADLRRPALEIRGALDALDGARRASPPSRSAVAVLVAPDAPHREAAGPRTRRKATASSPLRA